MSQMSDYLEDKLAQHVLKNVSYTSPANVYLALYTASPTDADTGTEVVGSVGYTRKLVSPATWTYVGVVFEWWQLASTIEFGPATGSWGTITHFGLRDASSGGNLLIWGALTTPTAVTTGQLFSFLAGASLVVQFA